MTCYELLQRHIDRNGKWYFYRHGTSAKRILRDIEGLCGSFVELGLKKGDTVSLYLPTCLQSIVAFYACSKLGLIASFVHPRMSLQRLKDNIAATGSKVLFFFDALVEREADVVDMAPTVVRCSVADYEGVLKPFYGMYSHAKCKRAKGTVAYSALVTSRTQTEVLGQDGDTVCYMHSGGTGGEPKIVALSNRAMNYVAESIGPLHGQSEPKGKYALVTLPVFHAYGLCASVHAPLLLGYGLALVPKFEIKQVAYYFKHLNIGLWLVVPAMLRKMLNADKFPCKGMEHLVDVWCGGDSVEENLVDDVNRLLHACGSKAMLLRGYGLTETCGAVVVSSKAHNRKNSCGLPVEGTVLEVVDDHGVVLPRNSVGEVVVYSRAIMNGYLGGGEHWSKDGGVLTGDVGYIDEEGYLYIVDRKKRCVKIASINVFPSEVESAVRTLPEVKECCVVGYRQKGKQYLKAFVTLTDGATADEDELTARIRKTCLALLSPYAVPERVQVLTQLPLTPLGKVDFRKLENDI